MNEKFRIIDVSDEKLFITETPLTFFELLKFINEFTKTTIDEVYQYMFLLSCYQQCVTKQYNNYVINRDMYTYNFLTELKNRGLFVDYSSPYNLNLCSDNDCDLCYHGNNNAILNLCDSIKMKQINDKICWFMVLVESKFKNLLDDDLLSDIWSSYDMSTYMFYCEKAHIIIKNSVI